MCSESRKVPPCWISLQAYRGWGLFVYLNSWLPPWEILFSHRKGWPWKVGRLLAFEIPKPWRHRKIAKTTRNAPPLPPLPPPAHPSVLGNQSHLYRLQPEGTIGPNHYLAYSHTYIHTGILHSEPKSTAPPPTFLFFFFPDADTPSLWQNLEAFPPALCPEVATACSGI